MPYETEIQVRKALEHTQLDVVPIFTGRIKDLAVEKIRELLAYLENPLVVETTVVSKEGGMILGGTTRMALGIIGNPVEGERQFHLTSIDSDILAWRSVDNILDGMYDHPNYPETYEIIKVIGRLNDLENPPQRDPAQIFRWEKGDIIKILGEG